RAKRRDVPPHDSVVLTPGIPAAIRCPRRDGPDGLGARASHPTGGLPRAADTSTNPLTELHRVSGRAVARSDIGDTGGTVRGRGGGAGRERGRRGPRLIAGRSAREDCR